jgi:preprotein translocase subunit SecD
MMTRVAEVRTERARRAVAVVATVLGALGLVPAATAHAATSTRRITIVLTPNSTKPDVKRAGGLIEFRLDKIGIDSTVKLRGSDLVVTMKGVDERAALSALGVPALRIRPVLAFMPPSDGSDATAAAEAVKSCDGAALTPLRGAPITSPVADRAGVCIVAPLVSSKDRVLLAPATLGGADVKSAKAQFQAGNGWVVILAFKKAGLERFNQLAAKAYGRPSPRDQVALTLQGVVESNPAFQASSFDGPVQISGGAHGFTQKEAAQLAAVINFGTSAVAAYEVASVTTT